MTNKPNLLETAYINLIEVEVDGEVKFEYGYELDKAKTSLHDISMFLFFLNMLQKRAEQDFKDRVNVQEKECGDKDYVGEFLIKKFDSEID